MSELGFYINVEGDEKEIEYKLDALLEEDITCVAANEVDAVEFYNKDKSDKSIIERFGKLVNKRGMKVVAHHGVGGMVSIDRSRQGRAMDHLKREVDRAAAWSCPCLVFHYRQPAMYWTKTEMADWTTEIGKMGVEKFDDLYREVVGELCDYAIDKGVGIHLETMGPPHNYATCPRQILPTLKYLKRDNLGFCIDTGHINLSGHDVLSQIGLTKGFPLTLHLNDNLGPIPDNFDIYGSDMHLVPGLGVLNWPAIILALRRVDYNGTYIFEGPHFPGSDFVKCITMTARNWRIFEKIADEMADRL